MAHPCGHLLSLRPTSLVGPSAAANVESISKAELKCCSSASCPSFSLRASNKNSSRMAVVTEGRLGGQGGGTGVLERPGLDQSSPDTAPRTEEGGEMGKSRQTVRYGGGDRYRVLLLDHERHTESHVAKVIPQVVPSVTPDEARKCFYESREFGFGLVTIAVREHAEFYVQMLTRYGLRSTMEQDGTIA
ncbi:unnamed protein product [Calypogeia fissa]